jgi:hypothetical protein
VPNSADKDSISEVELTILGHPLKKEEKSQENRTKNCKNRTLGERLILPVDSWPMMMMPSAKTKADAGHGRTSACKLKVARDRYYREVSMEGTVLVLFCPVLLSVFCCTVLCCRQVAWVTMTRRDKKRGTE